MQIIEDDGLVVYYDVTESRATEDQVFNSPVNWTDAMFDIWSHSSCWVTVFTTLSDFLSSHNNNPLLFSDGSFLPNGHIWSALINISF